MPLIIFSLPYEHIFFTHMGKIIKFRETTQLNAKTTVPLDVEPERRTKPFPPRFRPVGRFCELSFRYQSSPTGREGEISRPLDHLWQIPFIRPTRATVSTHFYIYTTACQLVLPYGMCKWVLVRCLTIAHALFAELLLEPLSKAFWLHCNTCFCVLAQDTCNLRMRISLTNANRAFSRAYWILAVLNQRLQITWTKSLGHRAKMMHLFRIKHSIN